MFRILEAQAPAKQNATDTISTLSGRLQSATLLEDRRAAILGLRSFAKLYPASVASGALRNLINSLSQDVEDVDTTKVVLETLLMLFSPDESSPEASDDIALWLADEFTQRQENITVLLDLLDRNEFFSRLYSLQLISAISTARPERTRECVYTAPLGVSRLVAILDDKREALRTEALLLLTALTPASPDLQKLVAFENAFERVFNIIEAEGSLTNGGVVVQDCLSLLANLLRLNPSNQSFFRETNGMSKVSDTLAQALKAEADPDGVNEWNNAQRDKNLWGFLSVIRLFLLDGDVGTQMNQHAFWKNGVVTQVLEICFHPTLPSAVRAEGLLTCGDLIRGNEKIQEQFSQRSVKFYIDTPQTPATPSMQKTNGQVSPAAAVPVVVNIIQGLLDLSLAVSCPQPLDVRLAATDCIKASLQGHDAFRLHFLRHAKEGHASPGQNQPDNVFNILLNDDSRGTTDIYRQWVASVLLFHLIHENYDAKNIAMSITEGDASKGEEVVTCIQGLAANLIMKAQKPEDDREVIGYLMVLSSWLFENPDAVNDFLHEGSSIQALIQVILSPGQQKPLEAGLCCFLLGIIYEFSTKDSPIPRSKLHEILSSRLGRGQFNDKMTKLRNHPYILNSEEPMVFDKAFVDFYIYNYSRIYRAFDGNPDIEVSVVANGVQKGISREAFDSIQAQLEEEKQARQKIESDKLTLEQKLGQEQAEHRRTRESAGYDFGRLKSVNESLQRGHEEELTKIRNQLANEKSSKDALRQQRDTLQQQHDGSRQQYESLRQQYDTLRQQQEGLRQQHANEILRLENTHKAQMTETAASVQKTVASIQAQTKRMKEDNEAMAEKIRARHEEELVDLRSELFKAQKALEKASKDHDQDLKTAYEEYQANKTTLEGRVKRAEEKANEAETRIKDSQQRVKDAESKAAEAGNEAVEKEEARNKVQTELDDLLLVLSDLEEKRAADKRRLKALGEEVSDIEDDEDEGNDEDVD